MSTTMQPGTPGWLRARNDRVALSLLLEHGPLTRNRLGELSGLSKPTAAQMVARLENAGLIQVVGEASGGRGPNAAMYGVRGDRLRAVAVDISDTAITSTVVNATGPVNPTVVQPLPLAGRSPASDVGGAVNAAVAAAGVDPASVGIVCVGVQAAISELDDRLSFVDTLPGWPEAGVRNSLKAALGYDVVLDNDVNLAAMAERAVGATADVSSFALLWMGAGLGLSVDLGGTLHRGAAGGAGEIGYLPVPREAEFLAPDAVDLTDLIGGPAVSGLAQRFGGTGSGLDEQLASVTDVTGFHQALAPRIALGVIPVLAVLDPERVVLGGPTGAAGGDALARAVQSHISTHSRFRPSVVATGVPLHPVLAGARQLLVDEIRSRLLADVPTLAS
ncbi:MAG: hypothetical protein QOI02_1925 [Actinomycetota bacterium]|nr:hypothetical protein [Actinomycetota bacterium]